MDMSSSVPSGPKPTKEAYLTALRTLKEQHKSAEEDMKLMKNSPVKSMKGKPVFALEEIVQEKVETTITPSMQLKGKHSTGLSSKPSKKESNTAATAPQENSSSMSAKPTKASSVVRSVKFTKQKAIEVSSSKTMESVKETKEVKLGKKATRRFTAVAGMLPNLRLNKSIKLEIASALMSLECWSDDEPDVNLSMDSSHHSEDETDSDSDVGFESSTGGGLPPESFKEPQFASVKLSAPITDKAANSVKKKAKSEEGKSVKHAYLEKQREEARRKAKQAIVQKAVKLYVRVRKKEAEDSRKQYWATSGKKTVESMVISKMTNFRVNKIINQGFLIAVDRRIKMDRRDKRRMQKRIAAQRTIRKAWRKFRVRFLLGCVIEFIRLKARLFREQMEREEREFRMRTAMRRVREDRQFKAWMEEQKNHPTFPSKGTAETPAEKDDLIISLQSPRNNQFKEKEISKPPVGKTPNVSPRVPHLPIHGKPHPPHSGFFITAGDTPRSDRPGNSARSIDSASLSITTPSPRPISISALSATSFSQAAPTSPTPSQQRAMKNSKKQADEFEYHRPDLAPFSTMINQMISGSMLFQSKKEKDWTDMASVGPDFAASFQQKKKSPAYTALEKLCGVSEADVVRSQLQSRKDGVNLKLKSFGHSIVSL